MTMSIAQVIILATLCACVGAVTYSAFRQVTSPGITSSESHIVWNYIVATQGDEQLKARFNAVNSQWPPTRADMGLVLLDAQRAAAERRVESN